MEKKIRKRMVELGVRKEREKKSMIPVKKKPYAPNGTRWQRCILQCSEGQRLFKWFK